MNFEQMKDCVVRIVDPNGVTRGTGFFVTSSGFFLTCHHVIADLPQFTIEHGGKTYEAEWWGDLSTPEKDVAVLKVDAGKLDPAIPDIGPGDFGDEEGLG